MTADDAIELCRSAVLLSVTVGGPVLIAALAIGLIVGLIQAVTQLHDQTISLVPKLLVVSLVIFYLLPWGLSRMTDYAADLIRGIPGHLH